MTARAALLFSSPYSQLYSNPKVVSMDKAVGLLRIAPVIWAVDNWVAGYIREVLQGGLDRLSDEKPLVELEIFDRLRTRDSISDEFGNWLPDSDEEDETPKESSLDRAWKIVTHPHMREIGDGGLAEIRAAISRMQVSNDREELTQVAEDFVEACFEFLEYYHDKLPFHLLGQWGGKLFQFMLSTDDPTELIILSRTYDDKAPPPNDLSVDRAVTVDESAFCVYMGHRQPCSLGNGRQFKLLAHLVAHPFRYLSFADLAAAMGGDELDRDAVIVNKCRLCRRLEAAGYDDLAKMILAQPDHYAFWPS